MADSTRNAGDPKAVKAAGRQERKQAELVRAATLEVMSSYGGRLFLWNELARLGVYRSIWSPNSEIHYRAGRQDAGHELISALTEAASTPTLEERKTNGS
jgi:hypothetical protein